MKALLQKLLDREDLTEDEMVGAMTAIMEGEVAPAWVGGFLVALRMKGESVPELVGAARVMREKSHRVQMPEGPAVDTCGTGGDGADTFNISTTAAFVVAGAGVRVAKHGNRAVSSRAGSADVLNALGVRLGVEQAVVERCLNEAGIGFLFAPAFHPAMKDAAPVRKELGVRTLFNLLGPLTNPAGVPTQVVGVFADEWRQPLAEALLALGCERAMVVHGEDGLDEITLTCDTRVSRLSKGKIKEKTIDPTEYGFSYCSEEDLAGGTAEDNARILRETLDGAGGPRRDIVLLNAGAAIYTSGKADSLQEGIRLAEQSINSGAARQKLKDLCRITNE
ncbi:MAG: anthranilate phosphoribosyltransferase [Nitrospina sp.]|nr:anthranilate phosphoribosyltransferase [Nitrospina sp.]